MSCSLVRTGGASDFRRLVQSEASVRQREKVATLQQSKDVVGRMVLWAQPGLISFRVFI